MKFTEKIFVVLFIFMNKSLTHQSADINIAGLFEVYTTKDGKCKDILPSSVQILEAVKWSLEQLNKHNYIPGVTIGLEAYPTCGLASKASKKIIEILSRSNRDINDSCQMQHVPIVGIIGPSFSTEVKATANILNSLPANEQTPQIGFSATASLFENKQNYPTFLSVIASDIIQVKVMVSLMKKLGWNYIAILYEDDVYGRQGATQLKKLAKDNDICIANSSAIKVSSRNEGVSAVDVRSILESLLIKDTIKGAVFFGGSRVANTLLRAMKEKRYTERITFIFSEGIENGKENTFKMNGNIIQESEGSYVVGPPKIIVEDFSLHWKHLFGNVSQIKRESKTNHYLLDIVDKFGKSFIIEMEQSLYVGYAIKAALAFGILLKEAYIEICHPRSYGECKEFIDTIISNKSILISKQHQLYNSLKNTSFGDMLNEPIRSLYQRTNNNVSSNSTRLTCAYDIYQFGKCYDKRLFCLDKIGYYQQDQLIMEQDNSTQSNRIDNVPAQCRKGDVCKDCIDYNYHEKVYFEEGDFYVVGVVPVSHMSQEDPMGCKKLKTSHSVELAEIMAFAVQEQNKKPHFFGNKRIGFIILNSCNQRLVIQRKILDIFQTGIRLINNSIVTVRDKILGFVGGFSSTVTIGISDVLSNLNYVQVGYASTATVLSDRSVYKYFLRVVPPVNKEAKVIISILRKLKDSSYVQVIYTQDAFGESFRNEFRKEAKMRGICIANEISIVEGRYSRIIDKLRKNPYAKIVLAFLQSYMAKGLSLEIEQKMEAGEFMFIGSVAWGNRHDIIDKNKKMIGSLKLSLEMNSDPGFYKYMKKIDIKNYNKNPWFKEYIEKKYNCFIEGSFDKSSNNQCMIDNLPERLPNYKQEQWTPYAFSAMTTFLQGANQSFYDLCGGDFSNLCEEYKQNPKTLMENILIQNLTIGSERNSIRFFDKNGDGSALYTLYNIQRRNDEPQIVSYVKVGEVESGNLKLNIKSLTYPKDFVLPSVCPNDKKCDLCFENQSESPQSVPFRAAVGGMTSLVLIIIVLIVVIFVKRCRGIQSERNDSLQQEIDQDGSIITDHYNRVSLSNEQIDNGITTFDYDIHLSEEEFISGKEDGSYLNTIYKHCRQDLAFIDNQTNPQRKPVNITFTNLGTV